MGTFDHVILPIHDEDVLWRRVSPDYIMANGEISRNAFFTNNKPDNEISMNLREHTTYEETARGRKTMLRVVELRAKLPRSLGFHVRHDPLPNERNPDVPKNYAHCVAEGENDAVKCDALAAGSVPVSPPAA